jgi:hypothetical protein
MGTERLAWAASRCPAVIAVKLLPAMRQTFGTKRPSTAVHPPSTN